MKRFFLLALLALLSPAVTTLSAYNDYRGHNLDSLERAVARWTPGAVDRASDAELADLNVAYRHLAQGYRNFNGEKSLFYARKALEISLRKNWPLANADALREIGLQFYGREEYDSALVCFTQALANVDRMAAGATSFSSPEGYTEDECDDMYSMLYGTVGNLYNMMDSIPQAMSYYEKAATLFDKYGWNESNAILYFNIGETWVDEGDLKAAEKAYLRSMDYALASGDSLMIARAQKGLGRLYTAKGQTWKALHWLRLADEYYVNHNQEEVETRKDIYECISEALALQRKMLAWILAGLVALLLLAGALFFVARRLRRSRRQQAETSAVMEETLSDLHAAVYPGAVNTPRPIDDVPLSVAETPASAAPCTSLNPSVRISEREAEILDLLAKGYTTVQIADCLCLSPETIKWYRKKLLVKFDVANTAELVLAAREYLT